MQCSNTEVSLLLILSIIDSMFNVMSCHFHFRVIKMVSLTVRFCHVDSLYLHERY